MCSRYAVLLAAIAVLHDRSVQLRRTFDSWASEAPQPTQLAAAVVALPKISVRPRKRFGTWEASLLWAQLSDVATYLMFEVRSWKRPTMAVEMKSLRRLARRDWWHSCQHLSEQIDFHQ